MAESEEKEVRRSIRAPGKGPATLSLRNNRGESTLSLIVREVRSEDGKIVAIKSGAASMVLREASKHFATWGKGDNFSGMITAEGYRHLNTVAGLSVMKPPSVDVAGVGMMPNPYLVLDPETGAFRAGHVRMIAVGPNPLGNTVLTDRTTYLSLHEYLLEDLIRVASRNPQAAIWGVRDVSPELILGDAIDEHNADLETRASSGAAWLRKYKVNDAAKGRALRRISSGLWGFFVVEPLTGQGIWFDRMAPEIASVMASYAQTGKFGIRKLEAIGYRNAVRDHPAMPGMVIPTDRIVEIREGDKVVDRHHTATVYFHEKVEEKDEIRTLVRDLDEGIRTASISVDVSARAERATRKDGEEETDEVPPAVGSDDEEPGDHAEEHIPPDDDDPRPALITEIRTGEEIVGDAAIPSLRESIPEIAEKGLADASVEALRRYHSAISSHLDQQQEN